MGWLDPIIGFGAKQRDQVNTKRNYRHRYRWAMHDMKQAGLNPILAATAGVGGSITGTSGGVGQGPDLGKAATNVSQFKREREEIESIKSGTALNKQSKIKAREDAGHSISMQNTEWWKAKNLEMDFAHRALDIPRATNAAQMQRDWGVAAHKGDYFTDQLRKIVPALFLGVGAKAAGRGSRGSNFRVPQGAGSRTRPRSNARSHRAQQIENSPRRQ